MSTAIPTTFRGVHYRSRLEARWAAMFTALSWRWEYEPVDLAGYLPDFVLVFPAGPVLVEVKPAFTVAALVASAAAKVDRSGWRSENLDDALIVGATWNAGEGPHEPVCGALRQRSPGEAPAQWGAAGWITCRVCSRPSLYQRALSWRCVVCGADGAIGDSPPDLEAMWKTAGNLVRWKGKAAA